MLFEQLEARRLMSLTSPVADLLVDANRDGVINSLDDVNEHVWTSGKTGRGATILPNLDKDNTNTTAPDNWTGGVWNRTPAAPNNVIDNAEKYCRDRPRITVRTHDNGKNIEIVIADEGIGISPDSQSKVFEKFFRISTGNVHGVKGFGLGLSFVKSVIKKHRGYIQLFSKLNEGTEVRIILPKA